MGRKIRVSLIMVLLSVLIVNNSAIITYAEPAEWTCSVQRFKQGDTNWCWAACARMIGVYHSNSVTQHDIVRHVKGKVKNEGATASEMKNALSFVCGRHYTVKYHKSPLSYDAMQSQIARNYPIAIGIQWSSGGGHMEVLSAYNNKHRVTLIDPWENRENRTYDYTQLINGTTLFGSFGSYKEAWTAER